jgi:hypothetical protein
MISSWFRTLCTLGTLIYALVHFVIFGVEEPKEKKNKSA